MSYFAKMSWSHDLSALSVTCCVGSIGAYGVCHDQKLLSGCEDETTDDN